MDIISVSLIFTLAIDSFMGLLLILSRNKDKNQYQIKVSYTLIILSLLLWIASMFFYRIVSQENILFLTKILYVSASLIPSSFLFFTYYFPSKKINKYFTIEFSTIFLWKIIIIFLTLFTDKIILSATKIIGYENTIDFGSLYFIYVLYILFVFNLGFYRLFKKYKNNKDDVSRMQIVYVLVGDMTAAFIAFITNLILPWFGFFTLNWFGQIATILMIGSATYAILRHHLFDIRVIGTEIIVFMLWIFVLLRAVVSTNIRDQVINYSLLFILVLVGLSLIRSVLKEVKAREKIETLAKDLEKTNENLTEANARLKELDQLKSEFVSLATHQIRSPLAAIKGYITMILEGDYGKVTAKIKEPLETIVQSTENLIVIVNDFLDVSRIEQGSMKFDMKDFDMKELVDSTVKDLMPNVKKKKLDITFNYEKGENYTVYGDYGKIKQIVGNLIDNATKYTPEGWIKVNLEREGSTIRTSISDSGVGIAQSEIPKLFNKFARAKDANETNVTGTGLGLYVAKNMIEAHDGGKIWVESEGQNKGTTFYIELKAKK